MSLAAWFLVLVLAIVLIGGGMWMRNMLRRSREQQKRIDWSKIRRWDDEEDDDWNR